MFAIHRRRRVRRFDEGGTAPATGYDGMATRWPANREVSLSRRQPQYVPGHHLQPHSPPHSPPATPPGTPPPRIVQERPPRRRQTQQPQEHQPRSRQQGAAPALSLERIQYLEAEINWREQILHHQAQRLEAEQRAFQELSQMRRRQRAADLEEEELRYGHLIDRVIRMELENPDCTEAEAEVMRNFFDDETNYQLLKMKIRHSRGGETVRQLYLDIVDQRGRMQAQFSYEDSRPFFKARINGVQVQAKLDFTSKRSHIDESLSNLLQMESSRLEHGAEYVSIDGTTSARCDTETEAILSIKDIHRKFWFLLTTEESTKRNANSDVLIGADILSRLPTFRSHPAIRHISFDRTYVPLERNVQLNGSPREFPLYSIGQEAMVYEGFTTDLEVHFLDTFRPKRVRSIRIQPCNPSHGITFEPFVIQFYRRSRIIIHVQSPEGAGDVRLQWRTQMATAIVEEEQEEDYSEEANGSEEQQQEEDNDEDDSRSINSLDTNDLEYIFGSEEEIDEQGGEAEERLGGERTEYNAANSHHNNVPLIPPPEQPSVTNRIHVYPINQDSSTANSHQQLPLQEESASYNRPSTGMNQATSSTSTAPSPSHNFSHRS